MTISDFMDKWKIKPGYRNTVGDCEAMWEDLAKAFNYKKAPKGETLKDAKGVEYGRKIYYEELRLVIVQVTKGHTSIGPGSKEGKALFQEAKNYIKGNNLADVDTIAISNFWNFYFYDLETAEGRAGEGDYARITHDGIKDNPYLFEDLFEGDEWIRGFREWDFEATNQSKKKSKSPDKVIDGIAKKLIDKHKIKYDLSLYPTIPFSPTLTTPFNLNPCYCLPKWDSLLSKTGRIQYEKCAPVSSTLACIKFYDLETYTFAYTFCSAKKKSWCINNRPSCRGWKVSKARKDLIIFRHTSYKHLNKAKRVCSYFRLFSTYYLPGGCDLNEIIIAFEGDTITVNEDRYGAWLIDEKEADFVYAVLNSSIFEQWCKVYAQGENHFEVVMWNTFPLLQNINAKLSSLSPSSPDMKQLIDRIKADKGDPTIKEAIAQAGQYLEKRIWDKNTFDVCMNKLCGYSDISPAEDPTMRWVEGFLKRFYGDSPYWL